MFGFGNSSRRKKCCGAEQQAEREFFPTVPTCPGQIPFNAAGCISTKDKLYDKILHDLLIPISGQEVKAYVCEPSRWSACQWVAVCYGDNKIAIFKIVGLGSDHLVLVNACQDGEPIEDNPQPGSKLGSGSVIYPVPPPWCSETLCKKITSAIENEDCACQGVLNCLANSEEVCFSSVPEIQEGEELHLFGGTMLTEEGNENDNPSLWKSCIKKLKEIFTGYTGKSICFSDLPETTIAPDIIDGSPVSKHSVLLDGFGCLRKGPAATDGCDSALDITIAEDSEHTGVETNVDNKKNSNAKAKVFDAITVCLDGVKRIIMPSASCNTFISRKREDNTKYWEETPMLGRTVLLPIQMTLGIGDTLDLTDYAKYNRLSGECGLYAIVTILENIGGSSGTNAYVSWSGNGQYLCSSQVIGATQDICDTTWGVIPLTENKITLTRTVTGSGASLGGVTLRLRGYIVGATAQ